MKLAGILLVHPCLDAACYALVAIGSLAGAQFGLRQAARNEYGVTVTTLISTMYAVVFSVLVPLLVGAFMLLPLVNALLPDS